MAVNEIRKLYKHITGNIFILFSIDSKLKIIIYHILSLSLSCVWNYLFQLASITLSLNQLPFLKQKVWTAGGVGCCVVCLRWSLQRYPISLTWYRAKIRALRTVWSLSFWLWSHYLAFWSCLIRASIIVTEWQKIRKSMTSVLCSWKHIANSYLPDMMLKDYDRCLWTRQKGSHQLLMQSLSTSRLLIIEIQRQ